jgi:hypothetical protein
MWSLTRHKVSALFPLHERACLRSEHFVDVIGTGLRDYRFAFSFNVWKSGQGIGGYLSIAKDQHQLDRYVSTLGKF